MKTNKKQTKAEEYTSPVLDDILNSISETKQKNIDRKMALAAKIYDAMNAKGWNRKTFAEKLGKEQSEITRWLSGTHNFTAESLWNIGDTLGIDLLPVHSRKETVVEVQYQPIIIPVSISNSDNWIGNNKQSIYESYLKAKPYGEFVN